MGPAGCLRWGEWLSPEWGKDPRRTPEGVEAQAPGQRPRPASPPSCRPCGNVPRGSRSVPVSEFSPPADDSLKTYPFPPSSEHVGGQCPLRTHRPRAAPLVGAPGTRAPLGTGTVPALAGSRVL